MRGALQMISDVESAVSADWGQQMTFPPPATWMGAFTQTEILIGVRGCTQEVTLCYEVGEAGRLHRVTAESEIISTCTFQRIRVLGTREHTWHIDPDPAEIQSDRDRCLWVWEARPLVRLQWDPGEWQWRDPYSPPGSPAIPFFQYSARLGRHILQSRRPATPAAAEHWHRHGLFSEFLSSLLATHME